MQKQILLFILLSTLLSCGRASNHGVEASAKSIAEVNDALIGQYLNTGKTNYPLPKDTLVNQQKLTFFPITKEGYTVLKKFAIAETGAVTSNIPVVEKVDSCFIVTMKNNLMDTLCNNTNEDAVEDYRNWSIDKYWAEQNLLSVSSDLYEGTGYILLNLANKKRMWTWNTPAISPNKQWLIATSNFYVHGTNGVQLIRLSEGFSTEIGLEIGGSWGASDALWIGDNYVLLTQKDWEHEMDESAPELPGEYVVMKIN